MGDCRVVCVGKCVSDECTLDEGNTFQVKYRSDSECVQAAVCTTLWRTTTPPKLLGGHDAVVDRLTRVDFASPSRILPAAALYLVIQSTTRVHSQSI
jgi:hypothetical protein